MRVSIFIACLRWYALSVRGKAQSDFCYQEGHAEQCTSCQSLGEADPCPVRHFRTSQAHGQCGPHLDQGHRVARFILTPCFFPLGLKLREPNFTLKRTFKVENTGQLRIHIETIEVSGCSCEGYGFKVVNCRAFALSANASKDIVIL